MRSALLTAFFLGLVGSQSVGQEKARMSYPLTKKNDVVEVLHGVTIVDPYRWLEDGSSVDVKAWVEQQNRHTKTVLERTPGRGSIRTRLGQLLEIGALGAPAPARGRYFFTKREGTQNQPILYVRDGLHGKDRVCIDVNELSKEGAVALDWWFPSKDGKRVAYGTSKDGTEVSTLHVRDVDSGANLPDIIERTRACSLAWKPSGSGFYYTRYPMPGAVPQGKENYYRHVYYHELGSNPADDRKVFGAGRDAEDWPNVSLSPDGMWLAVNVHQGWARSEAYIAHTRRGDSKFFPIAEKAPAIFEVFAREDRFYVFTNDNAPRYRLFELDARLPHEQWARQSNWLEILPQQADKLESVAFVGTHIVAEYMHDAANRLHVYDQKGKLLEDVKLPALGSIAGLGGEADGSELFFSFQSFAVAPTIYRLDLKTHKHERWGQVQTDIHADQYVVEQVKVRSKDGAEVPMFLTYKKGVKKDGGNPTLLYGYGGFNISLTPTFAATRFLFLEKGGVLAVANLRGGGEYGEDWHRAGMLDKKQNTFDDFIAAAEWLIEKKITSRDKLAIQGGSNGGLLVGAVATQRPELFKAVVCQVPLLDMTRYHKFLIARLWIPEYGDPDREEDFRWLYAYSPYHKVQDGAKYPATLLTTAAADSRVDPLHARKMAARLQAATASDAPILLRQETRAGHGAGKPRSLVLDEQADVWTFILGQLGVQ